MMGAYASTLNGIISDGTCDRPSRRDSERASFPTIYHRRLAPGDLHQVMSSDFQQLPGHRLPGETMSDTYWNDYSTIRRRRLGSVHITRQYDQQQRPENVRFTRPSLFGPSFYFGETSSLDSLDGTFDDQINEHDEINRDNRASGNDDSEDGDQVEDLDDDPDDDLDDDLDDIDELHDDTEEEYFESEVFDTCEVQEETPPDPDAEWEEIEHDDAPDEEVYAEDPRPYWLDGSNDFPDEFDTRPKRQTSCHTQSEDASSENPQAGSSSSFHLQQEWPLQRLQLSPNAADILSSRANRTPHTSDPDFSERRAEESEIWNTWAGDLPRRRQTDEYDRIARVQREADRTIEDLHRQLQVAEKRFQQATGNRRFAGMMRDHVRDLSEIRERWMRDRERELMLEWDAIEAAWNARRLEEDSVRDRDRETRDGQNSSRNSLSLRGGGNDNSPSNLTSPKCAGARPPDRPVQRGRSRTKRPCNAAEFPRGKRSCRPIGCGMENCDLAGCDELLPHIISPSRSRVDPLEASRHDTRGSPNPGKSSSQSSFSYSPSSTNWADGSRSIRGAFRNNNWVWKGAEGQPASPMSSNLSDDGSYDYPRMGEAMNRGDKWFKSRAGKWEKMKGFGYTEEDLANSDPLKPHIRAARIKTRQEEKPGRLRKMFELNLQTLNSTARRLDQIIEHINHHPQKKAELRLEQLRKEQTYLQGDAKKLIAGVDQLVQHFAYTQATKRPREESVDQYSPRATRGNERRGNATFSASPDLSRLRRDTERMEEQYVFPVMAEKRKHKRKAAHEPSPIPASTSQDDLKLHRLVLGSLYMNRMMLEALEDLIGKQKAHADVESTRK